MKTSKQESTKKFDLDYCLRSIKTLKDQKSSLLDIFRKGRKKGSKTYVRDLDMVNINGFDNKLWSWKEGEMNIWTGYNGEGKSQFLIFLCILKAIKEDWKFAFFSPENDPPYEFFDDVVHTILGRTTDRQAKEFDLTEEQYTEAFKLVENNFFFIYPEDENGKPDYTIDNIEKIFEYLVFDKGVKSVIVDPYIKIKHDIHSGEQEHLYASRFMMDRIHWTRKNNVSYHLVMHQLTPRKDKDSGNYPPPNLYSIKGGGTFADSTDNVLTVYRPNRGSDPRDNLVEISSEKIKKQKLVGIPSSVRMRFDRKKNRYTSMDGYDYFDGSIESKEPEKVYNPLKFQTTGINGFEQAPF